MSLFTAFTDGLLSVLYPSLCVGCRRRIDRSHLPICGDCASGLEPAEPQQITAILQRLPVSDHGIDMGCALWMFEKDTALQELLHMLKYGNRPRFGPPLGRRLGRRYLEQLANANLTCADGLLPVPLARTRYLTRGYNQSSWVARGMSEVLNIPLEREILRRGRSTRSQTNLTRRERWQNVAGAFRVPAPEAVADRTLLLVDDILTTGATVSAAARSLRSAGTRSVHVATIAIAHLYEKDRSSHV